MLGKFLQQQDKLLRQKKNIGKAHIDHLNTKIQKVISQQSLVVCVIDDYHCIHGLQRPNNEKVSEAKHMCTIIIKIFPQIKAIKLPPRMENVHDPNGISPDICSSLICSQSSMEMLCNTFANATHLPMLQHICQSFCTFASLGSKDIFLIQEM